jgi:hypothetical protein
VAAMSAAEAVVSGPMGLIERSAARERHLVMQLRSLWEQLHSARRGRRTAEKAARERWTEWPLDYRAQDNDDGLANRGGSLMRHSSPVTLVTGNDVARSMPVPVEPGCGPALDDSVPLD